MSVVTFTILLFTQRVDSVMEDKVHKQQDLIATDGEDPGFLIHFPSDATVHACMNTRLLANKHLDSICMKVN